MSIALTFSAPFAVYGIATLGSTQYFAAEPLPGADDFSTGQGPGLYSRPVGYGTIPTSVSGSNARRMFAITSFTRSDGSNILIGLGALTADIFATDLSTPDAWNLQPANLYIFLSFDGQNWQSIRLGNIEPTQSIISYMTSAPRFVVGTANGVPVARILTGSHMVQVDGFSASVQSLPAGISGMAFAALPSGFIVVPFSGFVSAQSGFQVANSQSGDVNSDGQTALFTIPLSVTSAQCGIARIISSNADAPFTVYPSGSPGPHLAVSLIGGFSTDILDWNTLLYGEPFLCLAYRDRWAFFGTPALQGDINSASGAAAVLITSPHGIVGVVLADLPTGQNQLNFNELTPLIVSPLPFVPYRVQGCSGRAYAFPGWIGNLGDEFSSQPGYPYPETLPVYEMLCNPTLADFYLLDGVDIDGIIYFGTADGWVVAYNPATGSVTPIQQLDGPVLDILSDGNGGLIALTASGLWYAPDGQTFAEIYTEPTGYTATSMILTPYGLYVIANNGTNSQVSIFTVAHPTITLVRTDTYDNVILTVAAYLGSTLIIFADGSGVGETIHYSSSNVATVVDVAALDNVDVTAAIVEGGTLWIGSASGEIYSSTNGTTFTSVVNVGYPVTALGVDNGLIYIGVSGTAQYFTWDTTTDTLLSHPITELGGSEFLILGGGSVAEIVGGQLVFVSAPGFPPPGTSPSGNPAREILVTTVRTFAVVAQQALLTLATAPSHGDPGAYGCYVRAEPNALPANRLDTYASFAANSWYRLSYPSSSLRFMVIWSPDAQATGMGCLVSEQG